MGLTLNQRVLGSIPRRLTTQFGPLLSLAGASSYRIATEKVPQQVHPASHRPPGRQLARINAPLPASYVWRYWTMQTRLRNLARAVILTGLVSVAAAGCIAVPVPGPGYAYGVPAPVVVVPAPVYGGYYRGYYGRGYYGRGYYGQGY
jgi:hypothetical protein